MVNTKGEHNWPHNSCHLCLSAEQARDREDDRAGCEAVEAVGSIEFCCTI